MTTAAEAAVEMFKLVHGVTSTLGIPVDFPLVKPSSEVPPDSGAWVRVALRHADGGQRSLTGGVGRIKFGLEGTLWVQTFWPYGVAGGGLADQLDLCQKILSAFQGTSTEHCVWFRNHRIREVGQDGDFYNVNVLIDFQYEQIKLRS